MGAFVAEAAIKKMILAGKKVRDAKVVILGLTFKENCPDTRNSKVEDIIKKLKEYGVAPVVVDPWASERDALHEYGVELKTMEDAQNADCIIVAVAHEQFRKMSLQDLDKLFAAGEQSSKVLIDVKGLYPIEELENMGFAYWRL